MSRRVQCHAKVYRIFRERRALVILSLDGRVLVLPAAVAGKMGRALIDCALSQATRDPSHILGWVEERS